MLRNHSQTIPCPVCQTGIPFDANQLLQGVQFACPNCTAAIGLADESKPLVQETLRSFEETRRKLGAPAAT